METEAEEVPARKANLASRVIQRIKAKLLFSGDGINPPNWPIIGLMFMSLFASAFTLTFLFPFLPEMILGFGYSEEEKGYYAGLVASSVFAGRATGSYFWGWLSDRKGRKIVLILTLGGSGVFSLVFGFTQNIAMAIAARFFTGLFSGILGTAKTVLYEVSDDTNQAVGMSMISLAWGAGIILGPATGGYLASPAAKYPTVFTDSFFSRFPYIIPAIVTFVVNAIALTVIVVKLPETLYLRYSREETVVLPETTNLNQEKDIQNGSQCNDNVRLYKSYGDLCDKDVCSNLPQNSVNNIPFTLNIEHGVYSSLLHRTHLMNAIHYSSVPNVSITKQEESVKYNPVNSCQESTLRDQSDDKRTLIGEHRSKLCQKKPCGSHGSKLDIAHIEDISSQKGGIWTAITNSSLISYMRQDDVRQSVTLFTIFSFAIIGFDDVFTVWASTDSRLDGLGFSTDMIGTVLSIVGIPLLLLLIFIFSTLVRHFGIKKTYMICAFILTIAVTICPTLHMLTDRPRVLMPVLLLVLIPVRLCASCCFSATALFINNSVTPENAGAVNGIGMTFTAIARTLAPAIGGSVFAWTVGHGTDIGPPFDVSLIFFMFGLVFWVTILMSVFMSDRLNRQKK